MTVPAGMVPLTPEEYRLACAYPLPYKLSGDMPDPLHKDVARVLEIAERRSHVAWHCTALAGLVIFIDSPADRWYICYAEPDSNHAEQWFREASGGQDELFGANDFDAFLARLDIPTRQTRLETRNGFRVTVFEEPRIGE